VGVPTRDLVAVRGNLEKLSTHEVDRKLEKLRTGSATISAWRDTRGKAKLAPSHAPSEDVADSVARVDKNLSKLIEMLGRLDKGVLPLVEKLRSRGAEKATVDPKAASNFQDFVEKIASASATTEFAAHLATRTLERLLEHPLLPSNRDWLTTSDTLDAFGRVANAVAKKRPNLMVALNEGLGVAEVLKDLLRLDAPIVTLHGSADTGLSWGPDHFTTHDLPVVWVIGHVARTGTTLLTAIEEARARYHAEDVFGAVLAASTDAAENFEQFFFHQLAESSTINLQMEAGVARRRVALSHALLKRAQLEMGQIFDD